jgi:hypothetical protein
MDIATQQAARRRSTAGARRFNTGDKFLHLLSVLTLALAEICGLALRSLDESPWLLRRAAALLSFIPTSFRIEAGNVCC